MDARWWRLSVVLLGLVGGRPAGRGNRPRGSRPPPHPADRRAAARARPPEAGRPGHRPLPRPSPPAAHGPARGGGDAPGLWPGGPR